MFAETDWGVVIPHIITSLTAAIIAILTYLTRREMNKIAPQVHAIDRAVNGQSPGTPPLVDKVREIVVEQARVADELAQTQRRTWADVEAGINKPPG